MDKKYVVVWLADETEAQGRSSVPLTKRDAEQWCERLRERWPDMVHQIAPLSYFEGEKDGKETNL